MAIVFVMEAITITTLTLVVARPTLFIIISALMFFFWGEYLFAVPGGHRGHLWDQNTLRPTMASSTRRKGLVQFWRPRRGSLDGQI